MAVALNNIGEIYAQLGDYRKAFEVHTEALQLRRAVGDTDGEANTLNHLGTALAKLGEKNKAHGYFDRSLALHRTSSNPYVLARTLTNLGALDRELGNTPQALAGLNEAVATSRAIHDRAEKRLLWRNCHDWSAGAAISQPPTGRPRRPSRR
jgi:tetratricopeptide (TPR) repeat protein